MALFEFTREDFAKVVDDPRFIGSVKLAIEENFFPSLSHFRGDISLLSILEKTPREKLWDLIKDYPLPYISPCEDLSYYEQEYGHNHVITMNVKSDFQTRQMLLEKAKDKYDPAWWCYIHQCESVALFILYPMLRILYPDQKFSIYNGLTHVILINKPIEEYKKDHNEIIFTRDLNQPCVFDLVSQCLSLPLDTIFIDQEDIYDPNRVIPPEKMVEWYVTSYKYEGMDKFHKWFASLQ